MENNVLHGEHYLLSSGVSFNSIYIENCGNTEMKVTACVIHAVVAVTPKGAVEELRTPGMAAVFYQDFETPAGDGGPSFPSSFSGAVHRGMNVCLVSM